MPAYQQNNSGNFPGKNRKAFHPSKHILDLNPPKEDEVPEGTPKVVAKMLKAGNGYREKLEQGVEFPGSTSWNSLKEKYLKTSEGRFGFFGKLTVIDNMHLAINFLAALLKFFLRTSYVIGWFCIFLARFVLLLLARLADWPVSVFKPAIAGFSHKIQSIILRHKLSRASKAFEAGLKASPVQNHIQDAPRQRQIGSSTPSLPGKKLIKEKKFIKPGKKIKFRLAGLLAYFRWDFKHISYRQVMTFLLIAVLLAAPFKIADYIRHFDVEAKAQKILGASEEALSDFEKAGSELAAFSPDSARLKFAQASQSFMDAQEIFETSVNPAILSLAAVIPSQKLRMADTGRNILIAGQQASKLGIDLSEMFQEMTAGEDQGKKGFLFYFENLKNNQTVVLSDLKELNKSIAKIDADDLPEKYRESFKMLQSQGQYIQSAIADFYSIIDQLIDFLGGHKDKRYLMVFQNNAEIRGSGGFVGSFALVDFSKGNIKNMEAPGGGSYDTEAGLREQILSPGPLHLVKARWYFWDANWWPDWPKSANKLAWFYEKSDGPTVDGVIALTPTVLEKLLEILGPFDLSDKYGVVIDSNNFWSVVQEIAEQKDTPDNKPKKIVGDLMKMMIDEFPSRMDKQKLLALMQSIASSFEEKQLLIYSYDTAQQQKIKEMGWAGEIKDSKYDYLMVANTNIAGGKTDRKIEQAVELVTDVQPDGSLIDTLTITRAHTGSKDEAFSGVRNINWMRIYVPLGSEILQASGFEPVDKKLFKRAMPGWKPDPDILAEQESERIDPASGMAIYSESGKTVFANWTQTDPGQTTALTVKYRLPFKLIKGQSDSWIRKIADIINPDRQDLYPLSILVQKQPGSLNTLIKNSLNLPANFSNIWTYPPKAANGSNGWQISQQQNKDIFNAVLLIKNN